MNSTSRDPRGGLGKLIYSVDQEAVREERSDASAATETDDVIQEAS